MIISPASKYQKSYNQWKICKHTYLIPFFHVIADKSPEIFPKYKGYFSVHHRNIAILSIKILQREHARYREITSDIFTQTTEEYNFSKSTFYLFPKIWEIISVTINEFNYPNSFRKEIRNWVSQNYPCKFRKQYLSGVNFLS